LRYEIRRANTGEGFSPFVEDLGEDPPPFNPVTTTAEDPETVHEIREFLGVGREEQYDFTDGYKALNRWRDAIEQCGVMVFKPQALREARCGAFRSASLFANDCNEC